MTKYKELISIIKQIDKEKGGEECIDILYYVSTILSHAQNKELMGANLSKSMVFDGVVTVDVRFKGKRH